MSDPGKYRTKEEVDRMMQYDPVHVFGKRLMEQERIPEADLKEIDKDVLAQVEDAVRFVEESPDPTPASIFEDVYVASPYINMEAAAKDPAWAASIKEDRVPEAFPAWEPAKVGS